VLPKNQPKRIQEGNSSFSKKTQKKYWCSHPGPVVIFGSLDKVEVLETVRIRRFAYEKWVYFFEIFYVDGEEEIMMRRGFIYFCPIDNFLQFFKVQSKFDAFMAP
jgi:hypothetical protein